jgi:hypothetical protein
VEAATVLRWDDTGFVGEIRLNGGRSIVARLAVQANGIVVEYDYHGCRPAPEVLAAQSNWRALVPRVPFSPAYGVIE